MKILKITFEDGTEEEFKEKTKEEFGITEASNLYQKYRFQHQHERWEKDFILNNLELDLEDWAKDEFNLKDEDENDDADISDFDDNELIRELKSRRLNYSELNNSNILNEDFIQRLTEIISRGDDREIDLTLEMLEKKYRIK